jgi:hypothetical protein
LDDTRNIAIKAGEAAASAHHRLDKMNGSIERLGQSHEKMRADFAHRNEKLVEDFSTTTIMLVSDIAAIRTTLMNSLKVAAVAVSLMISIAAGVVVYQVTHWHTAALRTPAQTGSGGSATRTK